MNEVIEFITPGQCALTLLNEIETEISDVSEMSNSERAFLTELILKYKPKKILELGVSMGGSSCAILNSIKDISDAKLYSIDINTEYYRNSQYKTGCLVDKFPMFKKNWELFTGNMAYKYMDIIGDKIDFCLIDTVHRVPGETLDDLIVLPYLKDDAVIVFHDISLHTNPYNHVCYVNSLLMSAIYGEKLIQNNFYENPRWEDTQFPNIGAIRICTETKQRLFEIFNLLSIRWSSKPKHTDLIELGEFIEKHYGVYWKEYYDKIIYFQTNIR